MRNDRSFIELRAREHALLDDGSYRELLDPFDGIMSPWLGAQGIVPQSDDGMVVAKGTINGQPAVVIAIEGTFQGGSMGEVSGAKMAAALELAAEDNRNGIPTQAVLCLETGGVRLQEANLGLAAIADIHAAIVDLRRYTPVVGIIAGTVGCFGGMSIAAALCSYLIVTREARLGLNGPQVIEQEAGIEEYDSRNRPFIWSMTGGEIRAASGLVDALVNDGVNAVKTAMNEAIAKGVPVQHRSDNYDDYLRRLSQFDTRQQAVMLRAVGRRDALPPAIVSRRHEIGPQPQRLLQENVELDLAVAQHVGIGRAPPFVLGEHVIDHPPPVLLREVDDVEGNVEPPGDQFGEHAVVVPRAVAFERTRRIVPVNHEEAHHFVALLFEQVSRHRGVDASRKSYDNALHGLHFEFFSRSATAAPRAASSAGAGPRNRSPQ